jgi:hypothetical protein
MADDGEIASALVAAELAMLDAQCRGDLDAIAGHLAADFEEFGASGQRYDHISVLHALRGSRLEAAHATEFRVCPVDATHALVTFHVSLRRDGRERHSLRSSLWRNEDGVWRIVFHQGTPCDAGAAAAAGNASTTSLPGEHHRMNTVYVRTSSTAVVSLVFGVLTWVMLPLIGALVAIICGHIARGEIRRAAPGTLEGDGMAIAGLVLGYVHLAFLVLVLMLVFFVLGGVAFFASHF